MTNGMYVLEHACNSWQSVEVTRVVKVKGQGGGSFCIVLSPYRSGVKLHPLAVSRLLLLLDYMLFQFSSPPPLLTDQVLRHQTPSASAVLATVANTPLSDVYRGIYNNHDFLHILTILKFMERIIFS